MYAANNLILGLVVAAPSGMGVILGTAKGGFSAMVGTAISASLLPPLVNCGIALTISFLNWNSYGSEHDTILFRNTGLVCVTCYAFVVCFLCCARKHTV